MELRKKPTVDLERYRSLFLSMGLAMSLFLVWITFEWKFYDDLSVIELNGDLDDDFKIEQLEIPTTVQPPPPPPKTILEQPEIIEVQNEEEILEDIEINLDIEISETSVPQSSVFGDNGEDAAFVPTTPPPPQEEAEEIFLIVEEQPAPVGGYEAFYEFVSANIEYPKVAREMEVSGRVFLQFIVDKTGKIDQIEVVKGIGFGCDEEARRVLEMAPNWKPGKQRGRPVNVKMTVPILFKLVL